MITKHAINISAPANVLLTMKTSNSKIISIVNSNGDEKYNTVDISYLNNNAELSFSEAFSGYAYEYYAESTSELEGRIKDLENALLHVADIQNKMLTLNQVKALFEENALAISVLETKVETLSTTLDELKSYNFV